MQSKMFEFVLVKHIFLALEIDKADDQVVAMELDNGVSTLGWDLHSLGVFNTDKSFVLESSSFLSLDSSPSTGYLEDAIVECNNRCKRKRGQPYTHPPDQADSDDHQDNILFQNLWNLNYREDPFASCSILASTDDSANSSLSSGPSSSTETKQRKAAPTTYKRQAIEDTRARANRSSTPSRKVAYPFEVVKPGGEDGDVTLEEINERILKRPSRPVRHPIGEFACLPSVHAAQGPGLSGKAVVALTRIQTQGRGTITIIRTRG